MHSTYPVARPRRFTVHRNAVDFLVIWFCVAALTLVAAVAGWQFWYADRIFPGVRIADVPVGGMTRAAALVHLNRELTPYPLPPVVVQYGESRWTLSASQLAPRADLMGAINRAYLVGRQGSWPARLGAQWSALTRGLGVTPDVRVDESAVRHEISRIAADVRRPGRAAQQIGTVAVPSQPGVDVDVEATTRQILARLGSRPMVVVPLRTVAVAPPDAGVDTSQPSPWREALVLSDDSSGLEFALDPATLNRIAPGRDPARGDEEALRTIVAEWASQVEIPAQDARLRFDVDRGKPIVLQPSVPGRRLNVERTIATIRSALQAGRQRAQLPMEVVAPAVDSNRLDELGIRELIASGTTYYAGSTRARIHNIEVAAEKFVGVVIPPDGIFSFNSIVEDVSAANGFEDSLIIWGDRTAVGVGGGVCQVSTTVFRAALFGGFPMVERYNHGYVVSWYGKPGMDATIYTPTVDFKFRNDTDAYLLIQPVVDSVAGVITFELYGTKPDRQVTISEPVISDVIEPGAPVYQEDDSLAPGQIRQVEWAKKGMTVVVERTVTENGETRVDKFTSVYQPWSAVYLYGPGTQIPGVTDKDQATENP